MIIGKAKKLLEDLHRTNYRLTPDFGWDKESELLVSIIANECKSTVLQNDYNGVSAKKYGSEVLRNNIDIIIRQLIKNGGAIPKTVMSSIMYSNGQVIGINDDLQIYKGVQETENGEMEYVASSGNAIINMRDLDENIARQIYEEVYSNFARQFAIENAPSLPKQNPLMKLKARIIHGREDREFIKRKFFNVLQEGTNYSSELIENTVQYYLDYMYSPQLKKEVLKSINDGTSLTPLGENKTRKGYNLLLEAIAGETQDIMNCTPDINMLHKEIEQIYADVETQLLAYSTDITKMDAKQIEDTIKQINHTSLKDPQLQQYVGQDGYRTVNVGISSNSIKLLDKQKVPQAMQRLAQDIQELVKNRETLTKEEYLKRAIGLQIRFIRIHPFPDSNGRTSRALLNMMSIPKGMLVNFPKDMKTEFTRTSSNTHNLLDSKGYLQAIERNADNLEELETKNRLPLYDFVKSNCLTSLENSTQSAVREKTSLEQERN